MDGIYLYDGKVKLGPFSLDEISKMTIAPGTTFWYEGLEQWLPIEKLPAAKIGGTSVLIGKPDINRKQLKFLWIFTIVVLITIFALYGIFFNNLSETELVEISFYWFGPLIFSVVSLIACYTRSKHAILYGLIGSLIGVMLLVLFFMGLWSAL